MSTENPNPKPLSLLSPEATGGDIATSGFGFQDAVLIAKIPRFLAEDGFTAVIREALCDFEASFFDFGSGVRREGFESKDYPLTPAKFWEEIDTFARLDAGDPAAYGGFTLVCTGLSDKIEPVTNGLRRVRDPYPFYSQGSGLLTASYADFAARVADHGKPATVAQLLFDKVRVEPRWTTALDEALAVFTAALNEHHPWTLDCRARDIHDCYMRLKALVLQRKNRPISRAEVEGTLAPLSPTPLGEVPVRLHTAIAEGDSGPRGSIVAKWDRFFGGNGRSYPPGPEWETGVLKPLDVFRQWLVKERQNRKVRLSGSRRLSTSLAIGWALPAVAGFRIEMEYREAVWVTDAHPDGSTPDYSLQTRLSKGAGDRLVVALGVVRDVATDVTRYLSQQGQNACHRLDLFAANPIVSDRQLNLLVRQVKDEVTKALHEVGAKSIDTFLAGPAPLALFLGHRLNAVGTTARCYEWVQSGEYTPTCVLGADQAAGNVSS